MVPVPDRTEGPVPSKEIGAIPSSLYRACVEAERTLAPDASHPGSKPVRELLSRQANPAQRYIIEGEIARGGMGAVLRAVDQDIHREVAVKFLLDQNDAVKIARFVEEAQITGQLEHPNIVPIHELGIDAEQRLFFSMKMVRGRSLAQVLDELRGERGVPKAQSEKEWPLARLLNIFVGVCNALAYAHSRDVVHRDLKPANIMVGDFGEVYVMDWGLAKVVARDGSPPPADAGLEVPPAIPAVGLEPALAGKVVTNRQGEADLTQEGAILGTPVYMAPEQALGQTDAIDQRSDIYALGAILYEILTLLTPVEKDGDFLSVLVRVAQGDILPPEERLRRCRRERGAGSVRTRVIPRELSAIAMKAMAKEKAARYATVESLRRDIERFQEGRSVSAKDDTKWEMLCKLVKRHKGFSVGVAMSLFVLLCSLWLLASAWLETKRTYAAYQTEQDEKQRRTREAVPAFVAAARMLGEKHQLGEALVQVNVAIEYDPDYPPAHLLKGQVLIAQKNFAEASAALNRYAALQPDDRDANDLLRLCRQANPEDGERLLALSDVLLRQNALGLSDCLMLDVSKLIRSGEKQLPVLRRRIEASWPGLGKKLTVASDGRISLHLANCGAQVRDLSPLQGMPLSELYLNACHQVRDLTPLEGMKLVRLDLGACDAVRDLTPLHGMPLTSLSLWGCGSVRDLTPLEGLKLTSLNLAHCKLVRDITPLVGMPLTFLDMTTCGPIRDLTPLREMNLTTLSLPPNTTDKDLLFVQRMPLKRLSFHFCNQVHDLKPLQPLKLTSLALMACSEVHDLTPLRDMPLTSLDLQWCGKVHDLTPLRRLELREMSLTPKFITKGMDVLRDMKTLTLIGTAWEAGQKRPAAEFWKQYNAGEFK
jgi:serine/threonine protein kinase